MNVKMKWLFLVTILFMLGCQSVSQYNIGWHAFKSGRMSISVVSEEHVLNVGITEFEEVVVAMFLNYDREAILTVSAPKLTEALTENNRIDELIQKWKEKYDFQGINSRIAITSGGISFDEAAYIDPFEYYDFISAAYSLKAKIPIEFEIYYTKIGTNFKLVGFKMISPGAKEEALVTPLGVIATETYDKANIGKRKTIYLN